MPPPRTKQEHVSRPAVIGSVLHSDGSLAVLNVQQLIVVNDPLLQQPRVIDVLADVDGPGCVRHIWMSVCGTWRDQILRMYWDGRESPSVECPVGDFFCAGWQEFHQISTLAVCVNPGQGFNCY